MRLRYVNVLNPVGGFGNTKELYVIDSVRPSDEGHPSTSLTVPVDPIAYASQYQFPATMATDGIDADAHAYPPALPENSVLSDNRVPGSPELSAYNATFPRNPVLK
jgi:hypothetical protein